MKNTENNRDFLNNPEYDPVRYGDNDSYLDEMPPDFLSDEYCEDDGFLYDDASRSSYSPHSRKPRSAYPEGPVYGIPGGIVTGILGVLVIVFMVMLAQSNLLPTGFLVGIGITLVLLTSMIGFLVHRFYRRMRFVCGMILAVFLGAVLIYSSFAMYWLSNTIDSITTETVIETSYVAVYVLSDDTAESINEIAEEYFGILSELDRDHTNDAVAEVNVALGSKISTLEYDGIIELVDALYAGTCRAIFLNAAYLDLFTDIEGYETVPEQLRELTTIELVEEVNVLIPSLSTDSDATSATAGNSISALDANNMIFTVYISGVDSRSGLVAKSRSDVNILAVVNTATHQVLLISTPRDYYVPLSISNGAKDKLTHAGIYGITVSMETIGMLYDVDVNYYARISFDGFTDIVDALGGVNVYSEYAFTSSYGNYEFTVGYNYVNGAQALGFARERYSFASGDRQRGKNQIALIKAIINKALSPDILTGYTSVLTAISDNFETSMSYDLIATLVSNQLANNSSWDIITYSVDGSDSYQIPYSMSVKAYVMIPNEETVATAKGLIQSMLKGETITQP